MLIALVTLAGAAMLPASTAENTEDRPGVVGPGIVSTEAAEFASTIDPARNELLFNRIDQAGRMQIWISARAGGQWLPPVKTSFSDARYNDIDPFVSRNGDRLYFSSNRPHPGKADILPAATLSVWYAERTKGGWSTPVFAGEDINGRGHAISASEDRLGNLYFVRQQGDQSTIAVAHRKPGGFSISRPVRLSAPGDSQFFNATISADGRTMIVAGRTGTTTALWQARRSPSGVWSQPRPLNFKSIPKRTGLFAPYLSDDGRRLYFTTEAPATAAGRGQRDLRMEYLAGR